MSKKMDILAKAGSADILISLSNNKGKMFVTELKKEIGKGSKGEDKS